jgi:hypothetical protein
MVPVPPLWDVSVTVVPEMLAVSNVQCSARPLGSDVEAAEAGVWEGARVTVALAKAVSGAATLVAVTLTI